MVGTGLGAERFGAVDGSLFLGHVGVQVEVGGGDLFNQQARTRLAVERRLDGPALETGARVFQAGDRILRRQNWTALRVLNGDLGTVASVNPASGSLTVRLDGDPETRDLPSWYLDDGHVDYGYA